LLEDSNLAFRLGSAFLDRGPPVRTEPEATPR